MEGPIEWLRTRYRAVRVPVPFRTMSVDIMRAPHWPAIFDHSGQEPTVDG